MQNSALSYNLTFCKQKERKKPEVHNKARINILARVNSKNKSMCFWSCFRLSKCQIRKRSAIHTPWSQEKHRWKVAHKIPSRPSPDAYRTKADRFILSGESRIGPKIRAEIVNGATPSAAGPNLSLSPQIRLGREQAMPLAQLHCQRPGESTRNARREPIF